MKRARLLIFSLSIGILSWQCLSRQFIQPDFTQVGYASPEDSNPRFLTSSLQILVYPQEGNLHERGLGTLTRMGGEKVILTHNHWDYLKDVDRALIVNSDNQLLLELTGREFTDLIRYRDRGTLVLKAPGGLQAIPANLGKGQRLQSGDIIEVVQRNSDDRYQVEVVSAEIISIDDYHNLPVIRFRLLDGKAIRPGDSGGGVWYQGELVGNTWGMYVEAEGMFWLKDKMIQTSIAALAPGDYPPTLPEAGLPEEGGQPGKTDALGRVDP
jgi:hypothetical protein